MDRHLRSRQSGNSSRKDPPAVAALRPWLSELSEAIASARPIDAALDRLLGRALEIVDLRDGVLATLDPGGASMGVRAARGCFAAQRTLHFARGVGAFGRVWASGEALLVEDYEARSALRSDLQAAGAHGLALLPIPIAGEVVGVLGLAIRDRTRTLDPDSVELLSTLARLVTLVLGAPSALAASTPDPGVAGSGPIAPYRGERADDLTDHLPVVLMVKDLENRVVRANPAAARALRLPLEAVEGHYLWELDPANAAASYRHDLEVVESAAPVLDRLEERVDAEGEHRWWRVDRTPVLDARGEVTAIVVLARDESEQHVRRDQLDAAHRAAERAERIKAHALTMLAHDVRVPLERARSRADRLLAEASVPNVDLLDLRFAADTALTQVQDLLDFARVETGSPPIEFAPLDLRQLLEDVLEVAWQSAHPRGIAVVGHVDPSIPALLQGDLMRVRQVLVQLLTHALRVVSGGAVVVGARAVLCSEQRWEVRLDVHASQWSPPPLEFETMFGPLLHGDRVLDEHRRAGGVGLALAHRLVHALGGRVGVQTAHEGESGCWCVLPFGEVPLAASEAPASVRPRAGIRVLVIESNESVARVLTRQLEDLHAVVDTACDGAAASAMIGQARRDGWNFDVCLVGERLADADVIDWIAELGDVHERRERVVHVVSFGQPPREEGDPRHGPDARLTQPVRGRRLAEILAALVGPDAASGHLPDPAGVLADERVAFGSRVFVLEADPLQQRLVEAALRRLGCEIELHSDAAAALERLDRAHAGEFTLALVDPRLELGTNRSLIEAIRRADVGKGHRPLYALVDREDQALRERSLAAGVDGVAGRPPRHEDLLRLLARHDRSAVTVAVKA